ncbi:MAG: chemotaxis response regulator protein-glutamate methylesterase [Thioalkalivibrionaceae bacterium]
MPYKVLVVDDSGFFRRRIEEILRSDIGLEVVGTAANGREAIEQVAKLRPDVVVMDIEMPVMDGISAVRHIMAEHPTPILMFSTLTTEGAKSTLDALEAGAVDYLPKKFSEISSNQAEAASLLRRRVRIVARSQVGRSRAPAGSRPDEGHEARNAHSARSTAEFGTGFSASADRRANPGASVASATTATGRTRELRGAASARGSITLNSTPTLAPSRWRVVTIGASTGGPAALPRVLAPLPAHFPLPIVLVQHMPGSFTPAFAERLNAQCKIRVKHADAQESLEPGTAYLCPGGAQILFQAGPGARIRIVEPAPDSIYKPSVDRTFESMARDFGGQGLAIVLTGMGADGREGAKALRACGTPIWVQDEASCVIYGMPAAIADAGLADRVLSLEELGAQMAAALC